MLKCLYKYVIVSKLGIGKDDRGLDTKTKRLNRGDNETMKALLGFPQWRLRDKYNT